MKRIAVFATIFLSVLLLSPNIVRTQTLQPPDFANRFISGVEAGIRARYLQEQIRLLQAQREAYEAALKKAQLELQTPKPAPMSQEQIKKEVDIDLQIFSAKHPDWKTYEGKMAYFAMRLTPTNISSQEYLEILYTLAKAYTPDPGKGVS